MPDNNEEITDAPTVEKIDVLASLLGLVEIYQAPFASPELEKERQAQIEKLRADVPPALFDALDRRLGKGKSPLALAVDGRCGNCTMSLTRSQWSEVAEKREPAICEYCGVILYAKENQ